MAFVISYPDPDGKTLWLAHNGDGSYRLDPDEKSAAKFESAFEARKAFYQAGFTVRRASEIKVTKVE